MPIPKTVASSRVKPSIELRPSARPATPKVMPNRLLPGAHLSPKTVAIKAVEPLIVLRPSARPASADVVPKEGPAGRAPHTESGRNAADEQIGSAAMRPPRAPGQMKFDAQDEDAGRALITQSVARFLVKPTAPLRPRAPGQLKADPQ
jgi:hypothetical protein